MRDKSHLAAFINATYALGDWELSLGLRGDRWENDTLRFSTNHRADDGGTEVATPSIADALVERKFDAIWHDVSGL